MNPTWLLLLGSGIALGSLCPPLGRAPQESPAPPGAAPAEERRDWELVCRQIESLNREMEAALRRNDLLSVASFYADDAVLLGPAGQRVEGRTAIDRYWSDLRGAADWKLASEKLGGDRETVYQIGKSRLVTLRSGAEQVHETRFVVVWRRQPSGTYRIEVDVYH